MSCCIGFFWRGVHFTEVVYKLQFLPFWWPLCQEIKIIMKPVGNMKVQTKPKRLNKWINYHKMKFELNLKWNIWAAILWRPINIYGAFMIINSALVWGHFFHFGKIFLQLVPSSYQLEQRPLTVKSKICLPFSFERARLHGVATSRCSFKITLISRSLTTCKLGRFDSKQLRYSESEDLQKTILVI